VRVHVVLNETIYRNILLNNNVLGEFNKFSRHRKGRKEKKIGKKYNKKEQNRRKTRFSNFLKEK
jgi:hypothetical protein